MTHAKAIADHTHSESRTCCCYLLAVEPDEDCPIHGHPWPPRCAECGQFLPSKADSPIPMEQTP